MKRWKRRRKNEKESPAFCGRRSRKSGLSRPLAKGPRLRVCRGSLGQLVSKPLHGLHVETSPEVPASDAAIRLPAFRNLFHLLRRREFYFGLAFLSGPELGWFLLRCFCRRSCRCQRQIMLVNCHAHTEISSGEDILTFE